MKKLILSLFVLSFGFNAFAQTKEVDQEELEKEIGSIVILKNRNLWSWN